MRTPPPSFELPHSVEVAGAPIRWGARGSGERALVLVHGHRAHAQWWVQVAPLLEKDWRLVALDLSGHGDSGHRSQYTGALWADEVCAVLDEAELSAGSIVVGHSMGGRVGLMAALTEPRGLRGVVTLDTIFLPGTPPTVFANHPTRTPRVWPTKVEAMARFRLAPEQPGVDAAAFAALAAASVRPHPEGWALAHDPRGIPTPSRQEVEERVNGLTVPWAFVRAGRSSLPTDVAPPWLEAHGDRLRVSTHVVPDAYHHLILDSPVESARIMDELAGQMWTGV